MNKRNSAENKKKSFFQDALGQLVPIFVPWAIDQLLAIVPDGTKVDDFLKNNNKNWGKITNTLAMLIKRFTNAPDIVDDIINEVTAESNSAILKKYGADGTIKGSSSKQKNHTSKRVEDLVALLPSKELIQFNSNLSSISAEQRQIIKEFKILDVEPEATQFIINLAHMSIDQFKLWADLYCPLSAKRKSKFEISLEEAWGEFQADMKDTNIGKNGFFAKMARKKKLM